MYTEDAVPRKRGVPSKMQYAEYADRIALKFGVLLEKWPLQKFTAPGYGTYTGEKFLDVISLFSPISTQLCQGI